MELTPKMAMCEVDVKAHYCPYCRDYLHINYGDDRYLCRHCGREFYILRYAKAEDEKNIIDEIGKP